MNYCYGLILLLLLSYNAIAQPASHRYHSITAKKSPLIIASPQALFPPNESRPNIPNINISNWLPTDQNEPSIAINPIDPNNILIGANDYRSDTSLFWYSSIDGGLTWNYGQLPRNNTYSVSAFNPSMAFDAKGKVYFTYGRAQATGVGNPYPINDVATYTNSHNGNPTTWEGPFIITLDSSDEISGRTFADKFYTAVDRSPASPYLGRVYVSWVEYGEEEKNTILISYSNDEGKHWSNALSITDTAQYQSPIPAIGPNGEVYVSYLDLDTNHLNIHCIVSTDGGVSFARSDDRIVSPYKNLGSIDSSGAYAHPVLKGHLRVSSFPTITVDRSTTNTGRIYLSWSGKGDDGRQHIYFSKSDDKAKTWSEAITIENDPSPIATDKFLPWMAVDNSTGDIGIVYYDSRNDPAENILVDTYFLYSNNGGSSFTPMRLTPRSFDPRANSVLDSTFIGDYLGLDVLNKHWYSVWADTRSGFDQELYLAIIRPYAPAAADPFVATEDQQTHKAQLSWQHPVTTVGGTALDNFHFHLRRDDNAVDLELPSTARTFTDDNSDGASSHRYFLQTIASDGDTSTTSIAIYYPRAVAESEPAVLESAEAQPGGLVATIIFPTNNIAGSLVQGLKVLHVYVDNFLTDSLPLSDIVRGETYPSFFILSDGFHKFETQVITVNADGDTIRSKRSDARWLYAGQPLDTYSEDFSFGNSTFNPFGWAVTTSGTPSGAAYINDSLPIVHYPAGEDTWFCLPPVIISDLTRSVSFNNIACIAEGDIGIAEVSVDDGVHFTGIGWYVQAEHPNEWKLSLTGSLPVLSGLSMIPYMGSTVITRFRLITQTANGDGWFLGNIRYSEVLSVKSVEAGSVGSLHLSKNPIFKGEEIRGEVRLGDSKRYTVTIYDLLGRIQWTASDQDSFFKIKAPAVAGAYKIVISSDFGELSTMLVVQP